MNPMTAYLDGCHSVSAPVSLDHCKQLAEPFLNVRPTWSTTGFCVHSDVFGKFGLINEALSTVTTGKWPFWPMYALVPKHVSLFPESFVTLRAVERSLPCVQALVAEQLCLQAETLVTFQTPKRLLPRVCPDVFDKF